MNAINPEFIMQVMSGCEAGLTYIAFNFALLNRVAILQALFKIVKRAVKCFMVLSMLNNYSLPITSLEPMKTNITIAC